LFVLSSETLQCTFIVLLLPLVAIIHSTAFVYSAIAPLSLTSASVLGFLFAGILSTIIYILIPIMVLIVIFGKRSKDG